MVVTLALAVALILADQLPTFRRARFDDEDVLVVRAWPVEWWYDTALDLGLGLVGVVLMVLGVRAGEGWAVPGVLVGLLGVWFLVRVALVPLGRRRNDAL